MTPPPPSAWAPRPALVVVVWLLAGAAGTTAVLIDDTRGRLLVGLATFGLAGFALFCTAARPRLAADQYGVTVRGLSGRRRWSWAEVQVRLVRTRRLGRDSIALELDADPDLVLLGWLDLGTDPRDVADVLTAMRT